MSEKLPDCMIGPSEPCAGYAALLAHIADIERERGAAVLALQRHGYRRSCDIPACNCGDQWNHGGHAAERLREIGEEVYENGKTILQSVKNMVARIAELEPNAKRYLWLRERNVFRSDPPVCHVKWEVYRDGVWSHTERPSGAELDTAIDAAMGDK